MRYLSFIFGLFLFSQAVAQSGSIRQIEKKMAEGNWFKSRELIDKLLAKDSLNMEARMALTKWFLQTQNLNYQFDSAYHQTIWSLAHFKNLSSKQIERLKKENADSSVFARLFLKMDSLAFEHAKNDNSESAYQKFLNQFSSSIQKGRAIELRDETAYLQALKINSYPAFAEYLKKYPQSARSTDATQRYDRLIFEDRTKDKRLRSFESFVEEFPKNPYRGEAVKNIFQIKTASGLASDFQNFVIKYSWSVYSSRAKAILFYLSPEGEEAHPNFQVDSLQKLNSETWIPIYKNGKYGFINERGEERIVPGFNSISSDYLCGGLKDEILSTSDGLIRRNGKIIFKTCHGIKDIGSGFLMAEDSLSKALIHKSGFVLQDGIDDASLLGGRFLVLTKGDSKCLMALNGFVLISFQKQSIEMIEGVIVLNRYGKKILFRQDEVIATANGVSLKEELVFDEAKPAGHALLLVRNGALEGLVNDQLEFVLPLGRQGLQPTSFGLIRKMDDYFILGGFNSEVEAQPWTKYKLEKQWLLLQNKTVSWLADLHTRKVLEKNADSVWMSEGIAFAKTKDSIRVYLNSKNKIALPAESSVSFVNSADSIRYFYSQQKIKKIIYDVKSGEKKLTIEGDQVESVCSNLFVVTRKNKKGLVSASGKIFLPFEYDAILFKNDIVTLLKDKKFGLFQLSTSRLIKPTYGCNLAALDSAFLIACKNDLYGIIDWTSKPITPFEFNEIRPWSKHLIWARKNFEWTLMNYLTGKVILSKIKNYVSVNESSEGSIAIVQQENFYGVVSSTRGVIIPPTLSHVVNVGSPEHPLYFTSKEVEEAGVFVVIYYDHTGQFLRKEVYEEAEYEKIVCKED